MNEETSAALHFTDFGFWGTGVPPGLISLMEATPLSAESALLMSTKGSDTTGEGILGRCCDAEYGFATSVDEKMSRMMLHTACIFGQVQLYGSCPVFAIVSVQNLLS